jgi:hypothetical protein
MRVDKLLYIPVNNAVPPIRVNPQDQQFVDMFEKI